MKNTLITLFAAVALIASTAQADISTYGYLDMAYENNTGSGASTSVAEFEYGMEFSEADSPWSAVVEVSFNTDGTAAENLDYETLTITYAASDALSFTIGNILSYQGFETYDATGLFQYSYAGAGNTPLYSAGYAYGASADYSAGDIALGFWVGDTDDIYDDASYEYLFAYTGIEGLTAKVIYAEDPTYETFNFWASYETGPFTFAYETVETEDAAGASTTDVEMLLGYYSFGDAGITVRLVDGDYAGVAYEKFTISPSYAFSDSVFGLIEISEEELGGVESTAVAAEVIYSF